MPNLAYLSLWFEDGSASNLTHCLVRMLELFPLAETEPGFRSLVIHAVSPAEPPLYERDAVSTPAEVSSALSEFFRADCAAELRAYWNLWTYRWDAMRLEWRQAPSPMEFVLQGEEYDDGAFTENGHLWLTLGLEHLFTGHAGILAGSGAETRPEDFTARPEYELALALQEPETLDTYRAYTLENIRRLLALERAWWSSLRIRRRRLWSEGEADLERRLEAILLHSPTQ